MIYIVEDDRSISEIESYSLKNSGYEVAVFENAASFYEALENQVPQLVLLDIMLPDEDGMTILKKLREGVAPRRLPGILVTAKTSEMDKVKGLDQGADDYLTKPFGVMELISRVKALLRRSEGVGEEKFLSLGKIFLDNEKHAVYVKDEPCDLTFKEFELLKLLLQNAGIVTSRDKILNKVWASPEHWTCTSRHCARNWEKKETISVLCGTWAIFWNSVKSGEGL